MNKHLRWAAPLATAGVIAAAVGVSHKGGAESGATVAIANDTDAQATVYISFGADSVVKAADWSSFCTVTAPLNCNFTMKPNTVQKTTGRGKYLNATISFNGQGCGTTKAEINVSNPKWYNVLDVSLVDGYSNKVVITNKEPGGREAILAPVGRTGNEKAMGVFPFGCDICVAMQHPPCGIVPGGPGCHAGTQYAPDPVCQWQAPVMSHADNSLIVVALKP